MCHHQDNTFSNGCNLSEYHYCIHLDGVSNWCFEFVLEDYWVAVEPNNQLRDLEHQFENLFSHAI